MSSIVPQNYRFSDPMCMFVYQRVFIYERTNQFLQHLQQKVWEIDRTEEFGQVITIIIRFGYKDYAELFLLFKRTL